MVVRVSVWYGRMMQAVPHSAHAHTPGKTVYSLPSLTSTGCCCTEDFPLQEESPAEDENGTPYVCPDLCMCSTPSATPTCSLQYMIGLLSSAVPTTRYCLLASMAVMGLFCS